MGEKRTGADIGTSTSGDSTPSVRSLASSLSHTRILYHDNRMKVPHIRPGCVGPQRTIVAHSYSRDVGEAPIWNADASVQCGSMYKPKY